MDICHKAELAGSVWNCRPYASAAESGRTDSGYSEAYDHACGYPDDCQHRFPHALYPYQYAGGAEFRLYPDGAGKGASGEESDQPSRIPQYPDSDHHPVRRDAAYPVRRRADHRDSVPDTGNRLYFLSVHCAGRYSFCHVLYAVQCGADPDGQSAGGYFICGSGPQGQSKLGKEKGHG